MTTPITQKMKELAKASAEIKQSEADAAALETYRTFRTANPHVRAAMINSNYAAVQRGRELDAAAAADEQKNASTATITQVVAAELTKRTPANNNGAPPAAAPL